MAWVSERMRARQKHCWGLGYCHPTESQGAKNTPTITTRGPTPAWGRERGRGGKGKGQDAGRGKAHEGFGFSEFNNRTNPDLECLTSTSEMGVADTALFADTASAAR